MTGVNDDETNAESGYSLYHDGLEFIIWRVYKIIAGGLKGLLRSNCTAASTSGKWGIAQCARSHAHRECARYFRSSRTSPWLDRRQLHKSPKKCLPLSY